MQNNVKNIMLNDMNDVQYEFPKEWSLKINKKLKN